MRFIFGLILGSLLTIVGAYIADSRFGRAPATNSAVPAADAPRPMVNWDVVAKHVDELTAEAQTVWDSFTREMTGPP